MYFQGILKSEVVVIFDVYALVEPKNHKIEDGITTVSKSHESDQDQIDIIKWAKYMQGLCWLAT